MEIPEGKTKVVIAHIVSLQGNDYEQMCQDIDLRYNPAGNVAPKLDVTDVLRYLFGWYYGDDSEYEQNTYDIEGINTPFLGYVHKSGGAWYLFSHNKEIGYASLSKIIRYE